MQWHKLDEYASEHLFAFHFSNVSKTRLRNKKKDKRKISKRNAKGGKIEKNEESEKRK